MNPHRIAEFLRALADAIEEGESPAPVKTATRKAARAVIDPGAAPADRVQRARPREAGAREPAAAEYVREEPTRGPDPAPEILYMKVKDYAQRRALSKRTIETLIRKGLPTVGLRRLRRIPVAPADAWLEAREAGAGDVDGRS